MVCIIFALLNICFIQLCHQFIFQQQVHVDELLILRVHADGSFRRLPHRVVLALRTVYVKLEALNLVFLFTLLIVQSRAQSVAIGNKFDGWQGVVSVYDAVVGFCQANDTPLHLPNAQRLLAGVAKLIFLPKSIGSLPFCCILLECVSQRIDRARKQLCSFLLVTISVFLVLTIRKKDILFLICIAFDLN